MNRYYVEIEHPLGKEEHGTFSFHIMAYDTQQIIDMIDEKIVWIEKTFEKKGDWHELNRTREKNKRA